nr:hypothetical protein [Tanacetum cinerariifolium]
EASIVSPNVNTASPQVSTANFSDNVMYAFMVENPNGNNEDTSSKAMLAIDGVGFEWSAMAEEHVQTNMVLMAFSDSE